MEHTIKSCLLNFEDVWESKSAATRDCLWEGKTQYVMLCAICCHLCNLKKKNFKKTYKTQENKFPIFFFKIATESGMPFFPKIAF